MICLWGNNKAREKLCLQADQWLEGDADSASALGEISACLK